MTLRVFHEGNKPTVSFHELQMDPTLEHGIMVTCALKQGEPLQRNPLKEFVSVKKRVF